MLPRAVALLLLLSACTAEPASGPRASPVPAPLEAATSATPPATSAATPAPEVYRPRGSAPDFPGAPQPIAPSRTAPPSLAAAEAEAAAWVAGFAPPEAPAAYRCVEASRAATARSGGFTLDPGGWAAGRPDVRLVPIDPAEARRGFNSPLVVRFRSLADPAATHLYEALTALDRSAEPPSWLVPLALPPTEGAWLVVANAGRNWGCFVLPEDVPGASRATSIVEAEQRGAEYPSLPPPHEIAPTFPRTSSLPWERWTEDRRCVPLAGRARSGEFVVSAGFSDAPLADRTSKFGFTPLHQPADLRWIDDPLRLELTYLDDPRQTYDYVVIGSVYGLDEQNGPTGAGFVATLVPPRAGRWLLTASSGPNWGCFLLDVAP
ncbi:MAG: hypothetical protein IT299_07635 [Dehalococcoidia bacterium]|nr:hypothetical protein [Dehalococcoidia bacterium]